MLQQIKMFSVISPKQIQQSKNIQPQFSKNFVTKLDTFERTVPQEKILAPAYVPFLGYAHDEPIRALGNIVCPCCGVEMMTQKQMNAVSRDLGHTSSKAIHTLNNYEKYMHPVEKECFNLMKDWSKSKPDASLKDLLQENKAPQLEKLQAKQNSILDTVDEISKNLPANEQEEVKKVTDTTRKFVSSTDKEIKFKRKTFLKDVDELQSKISNKEIHAQIPKEEEKMPTSQND
ncbi:hypothetical protein IJ707_04520, partial [bacterium]|nr:hypothetical protein [bacterium]